MSFATRCTACGTIFRVVQDQLRVSEGWVRCGRCAAVFDAREQLFDIDRDTPPVWAGDAAVETSTSAQSPGFDDEEEFKRHAVMRGDSPQSPALPPLAAPVVAIADPLARQEPQWIEDAAGVFEEEVGIPPAAESGRKTADADPAVTQQLPEVLLAGSLPVSVATTSAEAIELPSFMRTPGGTTRWQGSGVRLMMVGFILILLLSLALQLLLHFRDSIAAIYPQALPGLQALCQTTSCKVQPWRRIEALSVENSALTQTNNSSIGNAAENRYQLTLNLHNKSGVSVATPSIELSLLDPSGIVVLRRVLSPADFRQDRPSSTSPTAIAAGTDLPLQMQLTTGVQRISGYSVEIFYP